MSASPVAPRLVIITGLSGSGKTVALRAMEDAGFYAIDNLPSRMIPDLIKFLVEGGERRVAASVDVRSAGSIRELPDMIRLERAAGVDLSVLFLDSTDDALARRYAETRRPHPLADRDDTMFRIQEFIAKERRLLAPLFTLAQRVDTSYLTPHQLRSWIQRWLALEARRMTISIMSFGFKRGVPIDADFLFDVRSLPNPHYDPTLRPLTGLDEPVRAFLASESRVQDTVADIGYFLQRQLAGFAGDNRMLMTIAIGCTGGQHRSVYVAEKLADTLKDQWAVRAWHRDMTPNNP